MDDINIRPATPADANAIAACVQDAYAHYEETHRISERGYARIYMRKIF
jgi:hypothetical protein